MNYKLIFITALVIALVVAYFTWDSVNITEVTARELSAQYAADRSASDAKYLNKSILVEGTVKAYYMMLGARPVLELETADGGAPIFFFFLDQENEIKAGNLQIGQQVKVKGRCVGEDEYNFVKGVKIEVENIET